MLADFLFYLFSGILVLSAVMVVSTRNTVHSVMFLILAFFNAAGLFVLLGAEFLAMLLVIVYVGAIAVLFLFVVMMLNVDDEKKSRSFKDFINRYSLLAILIGSILLTEIITLLQCSAILFDNKESKSLAIVDGVSNTKAIGNVLYTTYIFPFQLCGMVLFVAMIGAIVLTLRDQERFIRKQVISDQFDRVKSESVHLVKGETGKGINV